MLYSEYINQSIKDARREARKWDVELRDDAALAIESAIGHLFFNFPLRLTTADIARAYIDAETDFPEKDPIDLGKDVYEYAVRSVYGPER